MRIAGANRLLDFIATHRDAESSLNRWRQAAENARWESLIDVRRTFPTADGVYVRRRVIVTVFNIRGNNYRLLTTIVYGLELITVLDLLTHAEYDKGKWKSKY